MREFSPRANQCFFLGVQDVENIKPVFDPDFHTELITKDQYEDCNSGNMETYIITKKNTYKLKNSIKSKLESSYSSLMISSV